MTRSTIIRLFVGSLIGAGVGTALFVIAAAVGTGDELLTDPKVVELYLGTLAKAR